MTPRENFIATVLMEKPQRVPFLPGRPRRSTLETWHKQGLPEGAEWYSYLTSQLGVQQPWLYADTTLDVDFRMIPQYEEKVLERKEGTLIVQDWKGNICEISDKFTTEYLRAPLDFVTRKWVKCPVETWEDWEQMKARYDPNDPARFPADFDERCKELRTREQLSGLFFDGPFMQLREWMGFEGLCEAFIEQPDLVQDMLDFWQEFVCVMLEKVFSAADLDYVHIGEDMAYKEKAMISPAMTRKHILPLWQAWEDVVHSAGCPIYDVDSDGFVGELIPIWIEAGFELTDPIEVAAGNDLVKFKQQFGDRIAYLGGVDKRAMAKGGQVIQAEMERLEPVIKAGGYIPSCDHGIPNDVSWPAMVEYSRILARITGWV